MIAWTPVHAIDDCRLDLTLAVSPRHLPYAWRPHGNPRVLALSCGPSPRGRTVRLLRSTWATCGMPRGLRAVSPSCGGPRATCRVDGFPARHISPQVSIIPFFLILNRKIHLKKIKQNSKKYIKLQKFIFLKIQLLFI